MNAKPEGSGTRACWFVGAMYGGADDQMPRFLSEGIWQNGYQNKYQEIVKSIEAGDRIAIKSTYTRKNSLPFDNRGLTVSVMAIKAIGTVIENLGDGRTVKVAWEPVTTPREWYFFTYQRAIWRVLPGEWMNDALIAFAFEDKDQDLTRFRNAPYWRERFGDVTDAAENRRFLWSRFYEAVADKLIGFRDKRRELVEAIHSIAANVDGLSNLQDQYQDGTTGPLKDICPFTAIGIFNRGITDANRKAIAAGLANFLGVTEQVPSSFEGIPVLNNQRSWFFGFDNKRKPDDIDALWDVFEKAIRFTESDDADARSAFGEAYDVAAKRYGVGWNLTMGLYWIRPWSFPTLDGQSQHYIVKKLGIDLGLNGPKGRCSAADYMTVLETLEAHFKEDAYPVHSFPELSLASWLFKDCETSVHPKATDPGIDEIESLPESQVVPPPIEPYYVDHILKEGCFLSREKLERILERLRTKRNLILQGPPGTGKTWLAKRLAFAVMGQKCDGRLKSVQFHPNLSYEDFVRGWRPSGDGKLALVDGPFMEMINLAKNNPSEKHVIVIEEINRGNPAQILGEMLTLLEVDKRTPSEALELCYRRSDDERVHIPDNLYVIGTMNIADRSLALVDLALRRRFAFIDLEPTLGKPWHDWVQTQCNVASDILVEIEKRMTELNSGIAGDNSLGAQFRVGHSYVTPPFGIPIPDPKEWFRQVVETEIGPLLEEYWFDSVDKAKRARERLLDGF